MSRRGRSVGAPMSFFSFQDIITSVTGIIILVTLLMALDLVVRADVRVATVSAPDPAPVAQAIAGRERDLDRLRTQVAETNQLLQQLGAVSPLAASEKAAALRAQLPILRSNVESTNRAAAEIQEQQKALREKIARIRRETDGSRKSAGRSLEQKQALTDSGQVVLLPGEGSKKRPIVVDCASNQVRVLSLARDGSTAPLGDWSSTEAVDGMRALAGRLNVDSDYFVLFVRPDAVELHERLLEELKLAGFDVGWDAVTQDAKLFPQKR